MAPTVIWTHEALDDIDSIAEYISRDSLYHAQNVVESIFDLGESLPDDPESGRVVPELQSPDVRERFIYSYRIIYEIKGIPFIFLVSSMEDDCWNLLSALSSATTGHK